MKVLQYFGLFALIFAFQGKAKAIVPATSRPLSLKGVTTATTTTVASTTPMLASGIGDW